MPPFPPNPLGIAAQRGLMRSKYNYSEALQVGYVQSVSGAAGCAFGALTPDEHGIDCNFEYSDPLAAPGTDPIADLKGQLKTWVGLTPSAAAASGTSFSYPLKNNNLTKLNYNPTTTHKILILMLTPPQPQDWIAAQPDEEVLRVSCYWVNLRGVNPSTPNMNSTTPIDIPLKNIFDDVALCGIMQTIRAGGIPR